MNILSNLIKWIIVFCCTAMICACAAAPIRENNTPDALMETVRMVWDAKQNREWGKVYDATDLQFKQKKTRDEFIRTSNLIVKKYTILAVEVDKSGRKGTSEVSFETFQMGYNFDVKIKEPWVFEDGQWRMQKSDMINPFTKKPQ
jgi:hypothetical protein